MCKSGGNSLSSSIKKQLQEVDQLIVHGKLPEAYEMINKGLKDKKISKEEELQFLTYKSELEYYFGNYDESIRLAELVLKENKGEDNLLLSVDACTWKATSSFFNGETSDCLEAFEKGSTILSDIKNLPEKTIAKHKAQLMSWQAFLIIHLGNFERGLELALEASSYAEKSEYKNIICLNSMITVECYIKFHEWERAKIYYDKALSLATEIENKFLLAFCYVMSGRRYNIREAEKIEELYKKGFSLAEEIGAKLLLAIKHDFGNFYRNRFQFDKAIECYQESLKYAPIMKWLAYGNLASTYFMKYDLEKAREYSLKGKKYCEEINDRYSLPSYLESLIAIAIELNNLEEAKKYLKELKELSEETGFEKINQIYKYSSISIMKASGKMSDLVKAAELLNEFLEKERLLVAHRLEVLYSLLEIRLKELQLSPDEETLKEVQKRLYHLEIEAEDKKAQWFLANVYRLQSQLALVELDIKKANELLEKAQKIADEMNIELLKNEIKKDREKLEQQLTKFKKFQEQKVPISETVKLVSLENTARNIKRETVIEERDQETGEIIEYRKLFALRM
ncbi:MAG: hypothetical protein FK733_11540 [Asgard group archaeon]|nr:hypothetical protein [Asgard group archaeon]